MNTKLLEPCCEQCWHSPEKPCHEFISCLAIGPLCHTNDACTTLRQARVAALRGQSVLPKPRIYIGAGTCGLGAGAGKTKKKIEAYLKQHQLDVELIETGCIGLCTAEPIVDVHLPGRTRVSFQKVTEKSVDALLDQVLGQGSIDECRDTVIAQHPARDNETAWDVPFFTEHPFFKLQTRWVLENCGVINPSSLEEYIAAGGYAALEKALRSSKPADLCAEVEKSGLRGRGGGGFPTGKKWQFAHKIESDQKYLVCNADEGDPGAFMDRAVIEGDPHKLLEGMIIAAYAIGASKAYVYIRAEYPLAIAHLKEAIAQAKSYSLLGENILGSGFSLDIRIKHGAGAFVCGEETALLHSIEGKRGMPRSRPPYPAVSGLFGKPTVINNVETLANIPKIIQNGADWFAAVGTQGSKGTKVFALSGKIKNTGLVEVKMGITLRQIVFDIGGGIINDKKYKAVQIGGPSGGCIPESELDINIDYESLKTLGAMMGSGGLVVMDENTCMVDVAKFFMDFIQRESCGKCIPCREGTKYMLHILTMITEHAAGKNDISALQRFNGVMQLEQLAQVIKDTSLCGLGQTAPNPILSTLRWFRHEYEQHIFENTCAAKVCKNFITYEIDAETCIGCTLCARNCPVEAIKGAPKSPHYILSDVCIRCGLCVSTCRVGAVKVK
ncbi:MAG TPA: NADH-quinone oxidoreductase subunit NuoF [bacterium]|nr:NADH-quinone oxidoreductase subunit NuoF [bacterium]